MTLAAARAPKHRSEAYVVGILFVTYTLCFLDRQIVNILAEPIKRDLQIADWQIGFLSGLAFAVLYTTVGIPMARWADKPTSHRPLLISTALAVWSAMTMLCGIAQNFGQLVAARFGVGIGEAGCAPSAHSLISDIVPKERRATALAIYSLGVPFGKLIGMVFGGLIASLYGWRVAFLLAGLPGLAVALLVWLTVPDPRSESRPSPTTRAPFGPLLAAMLRRRAFVWATLAAGFMTFVSNGQLAFLASFFIRVYGLTVAQAGLLIGLAIGLAGALGSWLGGWCCDRLAPGRRWVYMVLPGVAAICGALLFIAGIATHSFLGCAILLSLAFLLSTSWYGPVFATIQGLVPQKERATAAALHLFIMSLIGIGLGPLAFGALSDAFNHGFTLGSIAVAGHGLAEGLRAALIGGTCVTILALICFVLAGRALVRQP